MVACTIVSADEIPNAAVLASSLLRFHPDAKLAVLVLDDSSSQLTISNASMLSLVDLGLASGEEWRLPMLFGIRELRTLLVPALLDLLLSGGAASVACFSGSTEIFAPLTDVFDIVTTADAVVATESIQNEWGDAGRSFVAAPSNSQASVREWLERMREIRIRKAALDVESSPESEALLDSLRIIRQPGFGVNYSNLQPEQLTRDAHGYALNGELLRSFDFRGYDPAKPYLLSRYLGLEPRILLSESPLLAEICDTYREQLLSAGHAASRAGPGPWQFLASGLRIDARMLRLYRQALAKFEAGAADEPPSPFGPEGESGFLRWLNEPVDQAEQGVTRYMLAVYEDRPDVRTAYPEPTNRDAAAFRNWYLVFGSRELDLPSALVPATEGGAPSSSATVVSAPASVNVAGYFRAELGIGAAARALVAALEAAEVQLNTVSFDRTANRLTHPFTDRSASGAGADINIVCVNADQISAFAEQTGPEFRHGRYTIGVWFWEAEDFPRSFHHAFNYVDEIWVASEFMRETFLKVSPKPVFKYPLPVLTPTIDRSLTRASLGLPEQFLFLFSFDFLSVLERKNPLGLIEAFTRAFEPNAGPRLVIKTINGDKRVVEVEKLKYAVRDRPDIILKDGYLSAAENSTFSALADCYVSVHRSEGFGLTMAEAMALGKPVIATAYSGNLEFMTAENSYLCPARRCEIGPEREPYPADSFWSEPDVGAAADLLRRVFLKKEEAKARGTRAAADLNASHSPSVAGESIVRRLATIRRRRAQPGLRSNGFLQDRIDELEARLRSPWPADS